MRSRRKEKYPVWCALLVTLLVAGVFLFCLVSIAKAPIHDVVVVDDDCTDDGENFDDTCNSGAAYIIIDPPEVQSYEIVAAAAAAAATAAPPNSILYRGVSLSGGECPDDVKEDGDHRGEFIPTLSSAELFIYKGMNTFRIPVVWEYMADAEGNMGFSDGLENVVYFRKINKTVHDLLARKAYVILDLHNYMRYNHPNISLDKTNTAKDGSDVITGTNAAYVNFWRQLAAYFHHPNIIYSVMNEPHDVHFNTLSDVIVATASAIRSVQAETVPQDNLDSLILVPGVYWDRIDTWFKEEINSKLVPLYNESISGRYAVEVHQYFDADKTYTGQYVDGECVAWEDFDAYWKIFRAWVIKHKQTVFIGAFGAPDTEQCRETLSSFMDALNELAYNETKGYGVIGWAAWGGGLPGCGLENAPMTLSPGGSANALMWNASLYENYLVPPPNSSIPELLASRAMIRVKNDSPYTLRYQQGYVPIQVIGTADVGPGSTRVLYASNNFSTPYEGISNHYYIVNQSDSLGFGVDRSPASPIRSSYSFTGRENNIGIDVEGSTACPINITGPDANTSDTRCFVVLQE